MLANSFISFIGAGILGLPYAFSRVGVAMGSAITIVVGAVNLWAMLLLVRSKYLVYENTGRLVASYGELASAALGPFGRFIVDVCVGISQISFCVSYLIFVGESASQIIQTSLGDAVSKAQVISICLPFVVLCTFLRCVVIALSW